MDIKQDERGAAAGLSEAESQKEQREAVCLPQSQISKERGEKAFQQKLYPTLPLSAPLSGPQSIPLPSEDVDMDEKDKQLTPEEKKLVKSFLTPIEKLKDQVEQLTHQMESYNEGQKQNITACPEQFTSPTQSVQQLQQMLQPEPSPSMQILPPPYPELMLRPAGAEGNSAKMSSGKQWSGIVRDAILGEWQAVGTLACPILFDQQAPRYEQHCWKILQQIKQTGMEL